MRFMRLMGDIGPKMMTLQSHTYIIFIDELISLITS